MSSFIDRTKASLSDCQQFNDTFSMSSLIFVISLFILAIIGLLYLWEMTNGLLMCLFWINVVLCPLSFLVTLYCPITTYIEMKKIKKNKVHPI